MSLDGFIAGPGHRMDFGGGRLPASFVAPDDIAEIAAATGAMLTGRRTWDVGSEIRADDPGAVDYPFSGPFFLLTHRPPEPPVPGVTVLSGDIGEAVATALRRSGRQEPGDPRRRRGRAMPGPGTRRRDPGVRASGAARRRHPVLVPGAGQGRPGTDQQRAVGRGHHPPVPRSQVSRRGARTRLVRLAPPCAPHGARQSRAQCSRSSVLVASSTK